MMDDPKMEEFEQGYPLHLQFKNDAGLNLLLPLYQFLRNECSHAAHLTLVKGFKEAEYVKKYMRNEVASASFYEFLKEVQRLSKRSDSKDQKGRGSTKKFTLLHNLSEHEETLKRVTTQDLIDQNMEKCGLLRDLDLSFQLNLIVNAHIHYQVDEKILTAVNQIKEIRNGLFHPKLNFSQGDFDENFKELIQATDILYHYVYPNEPINFLSVKEAYLEQVLKVDVGSQILSQLQTEIHRKYTVLPTFIAPTIVDLGKCEMIIEDLPKYVATCSRIGSNKTLPILLCGSAGAGKSTTLKNLAFSSLMYNRYLLILYLDDWNRKKDYQAVASELRTSTDFWEEIFNSINNVAQNTVNLHGFDVVRAVIRKYMDRILFLVNWNLKSLGAIVKEMERGTWVVTYQDIEPRTNDWQVLKIKPFTEMLVIQMLHKYSAGNQGIVDLYKNCEFKDILTSPDMIKVFLELKSTVCFDTDFEVSEAFLSSKLKHVMSDVNINNEVLKLGEVAYNSVKNGSRNVYREKELCYIDSEIRDLFLVHSEDGGTQFIHSPIQEILAAKYVVALPNKACIEWLPNAYHFMNVFKFACGIWCKDIEHLDVVLCYMEDYLIELFDIESLRKNKETQVVESMEVKGIKKKKTKIKMVKKPQGSDKPLKNPFSNWDYLIALDDVCQGQPKIIKLFAKLLSHTRGWTVKSDGMDERKLKRIEIIISKVKLNKESPVTIKLESMANLSALINIWNRFKNIQSLHGCTFIKISICKKGYPFLEEGNLSRLCSTIARTHCPFYITSYRGPFFCSTTPEFLKCMSVSKLVIIDVTVYDVASLSEILKCDGLYYLKDISVNVELKMEEMLLAETRLFKIPEHSSLMLKIKYFDNIQKLLDRIQSPQNLKSLSLHEVYVNENFSLDLSHFECMENLNIRCESGEDQHHRHAIEMSYVDEHFQVMEYEKMAVDEGWNGVPQKKRISRSSWMLPITVDLTLPKKLERLLFRNMDFYNNSNNYFLLNILKKYSIKKLVILDSQLSLKGVRQILISHGRDEVDELEYVTKKLKKNKLEATNVHKFISKRPRLNAEEREHIRATKREGKEIVITSDVGICQTCYHFPCSCLNHDEKACQDTLEDLVCLIEELYDYDIIRFNYSSQIITVRKDVCGDLLVHCTLPGLNDATTSHLTSSDSWLNKLFLALTLAQHICLEQTHLTFKGVKVIIDFLKHSKAKYSEKNVIEPFLLTVRSTYHPSNDQVISAFIETLWQEEIFTVFNFWCSCQNKCFKIKKAYNGKVIYNDRILQKK